MTRTIHPLPFQNLSPLDFERLCFWLARREGYDDAEHLGASGNEGGRDVVATRDGRRVVFQCKRVQSFGPSAAEAAVTKLLELPAEERPEELVFVVACNVSVEARDRARERAGSMACEFWAGSELDERVKGHEEVVTEFFEEASGGGWRVRTVDVGRDVIDSVISTGDGAIINVHKTVYQGAPPRSSPLRPTPPRPPAHFAGRKKKLDRLTGRLRSGEHVAITALQGMGGIGKTALAQKLAEDLRDDFPGGVLWSSLGTDPDVATVLETWARHADPKVDFRELPEAADRVPLVRSMLEPLGRLCAIVDDVWQADAARTLFEAVPPGCPILITTRLADVAKTLRCRLERIDQLPERESLELLARLLGPLDGYEEAAREVAGLTGGLPLALEIAAGLVDEPSELPELVERLRTKPTLDVLKLPGQERREESVEVCLALSYQTLDADLQRRFRALGVFAEAPIDAELLAAVWGDEDEEATAAAVKSLRRRNLLARREEADGFVQHTLLRAYAEALMEEEGEAETAFARFADHCQRIAQNKNWWEIEAAYEQIQRGWEWVRAHDSDRIIDYVFSFQDYQVARGRGVDQLGWLEVGLRQARESGNRQAEAAMLSNIGFVYSAQGRKNEALEYYEKALPVQREVGDRGGEATILNNIGLMYLAQGRKQEALEYYKRALFILREIGGMEAATLNNIGGLYSVQGRKQEALEYYKKALLVQRKIGDRGKEVVASLNNIGRVYSAQGKKQEALGYYEEALSILREVGDRGMEATALNNIGLVCHDLGRKQEALKYYERALLIQREVGDRDGEATTLNNIGFVYHKLGHNREALGYYRKALPITREIGDRGGAATALNNIGLVYSVPGRMQKALEYFEKALSLTREVGDRGGESTTLYNIGHVLANLGRTAEAVRYLEMSAQLAEEVDHPDLAERRAKLAEVRAKLDQET